MSGLPNADILLLFEGTRGVSCVSDGTGTLTRTDREDFVDAKLSSECEASSLLDLNSVGEVSLGEVEHFPSLTVAFLEGLGSSGKPAMETDCDSCDAL